MFFLNVLGSLKNLQSDWEVIHYVLCNNFFYNQRASAFVLQIDSYYVHDNIDVFFSFFSSIKFWYIFLESFFTFCLFLLLKDFDIFHIILFGAFPYFLDNIWMSILYIEKKNTLSILICLKNLIYCMCQMSFVSYMSYVSSMSILWVA